MFTKSVRRLLSAVAISGCLVGTAQVITSAQEGLTIFSGVERENILSYRLDYNGIPGNWDRYRLRIPAKKMVQDAVKFYVTYPDYYEGKFDPDEIEVRIDGEALPLKEVIWDQESRIIEIELEEPIDETRKVELVFSDVKNPRSPGTFYFHGQVLSASDIPVRQYVGTWIIGINRQ